MVILFAAAAWALAGAPRAARLGVAGLVIADFFVYFWGVLLPHLHELLWYVPGEGGLVSNGNLFLKTNHGTFHLYDHLRGTGDLADAHHVLLALQVVLAAAVLAWLAWSRRPAASDKAGG
jgi:hypothetical protein